MNGGQIAMDVELMSGNYAPRRRRDHTYLARALSPEFATADLTGQKITIYIPSL